MSSEQRSEGVMANTAHQTGSEAIAAFPEGQSLLERLPDEIHLNIFKHLAPVHSALKNNTDHQAHRAVLHSLCLVSKRMEVFAREELYREVRLYSNERAIRLFVTLLTHPNLIGHVKSILFFPSMDRQARDTISIDLSALQSLNDPDFDYWATLDNPAQVTMPEVTRDKMAYNMLFKVLLQTPNLEALYIRLPKHHGHRATRVFRRTANAKCKSQLAVQNRLFESPPIPALPRLKKLGILGGGLRGNDAPAYRVLVPFFQSLLRSPILDEVCWAGLGRGPGVPGFWDVPLLSRDLEHWPAPPSLFNQVSTTVKKLNLRNVMIPTRSLRGLTVAFPSIESLTIEDRCSFVDAKSQRSPVPQLVFGPLGQLANLHTLVFDNDPEGFGTFATTDTGICKTVNLSAMSKVETLLVSLDLLAYFTLGENALIQPATTILPGSVRRLTLLHNTACKDRLSRQLTQKVGVDRVFRDFMQDLATTLIVLFPNLDTVDVCYHMESYRRGNVFTLADRSETRAA